MKNKIKILLFVSLMALTFTACNKVSTAQLEKEVKQLFNKKNKEIGIKATNVTLIKEDDMNYNGTITVEAEGEEETLDINVTTDGRSFKYEIPAFLDD